MSANKHTPGWYCANCQRGVDAREVTFSEQHEACGRFIADDEPPSAERQRLNEAAPDLLEALSIKVKDAEQRVFEDWLESKSHSGDHEQVQRQWLESSDYRDFVAEWGDQLAAIAKSTGGAA